MAVATVVIPCGPRHVPLLARAVRSAYAQTVPVEVLTFIDTERKGPAYGRNRLAEQVTTPFIVQLDADDYLLPHAVERMLSVWEPGYYITSDWYQGSTHVRAVSCYGLRREEGEADFHLPPSLIPTAYWHAAGGQDESLFGAEDTEFFFRLNALRVHHKIVREPLFHYTPDGYRSREASQDTRWLDLIQSLFGKYRGKMSMGCCGNIQPQDKTLVGEHREGDLVAAPVWKATQKTRGRATGRNYGKINRTHTVYLDPLDYAANPGEWTIVTDWQALAPTQAQVKAALAVNPDDPVAVLADRIAKAGIRTSWEPVVTSGYDIQQTPLELAQFLVWCQEHDVKTVLEIGTGDSAGLARFLVQEMGWEVTSIDVKEPNNVNQLLDEMPRWHFFVMDTQKDEIPALITEWAPVDLVFIDGDHSYDGAKRDYEQFAPLGRIVALHDIAPDGWWAEGTAKYWRDLAYTSKGNLRKDYHEVIIANAKQGIGWHER